MAIRWTVLGSAVAAMALLLGGCEDRRSGPILVSAIGSPPKPLNPNLRPLDPAAAFLLQAVAQGLVRFDATGQVEPALAQSWIVSNDGLRYTFRLVRTEWSPAQPVTAQQVVGRLRAAISRASSNPLKLQLGAIDEIEAMTDNVLEIRLKGPRPNFLQLLAQPEMAVSRDSIGTGPYRMERQPDRSLLLAVDQPEDDDEPERGLPPIVLRGERAALAVARFAAKQADLVVGGTAGDLPIAREADLPATALHFDPVAGLFGLQFASRAGVLADPAVRQALSMAVDREALVDDIDVPNLAPRASLVPDGIDELQEPIAPDWAALSMQERRQRAAPAIAAAAKGEPLEVRVAMPAGPGYRLMFAHLRRDWAQIGVATRLVGLAEPADLRLVDAVAPIAQAAWYLRRFSCDASPVCLPEADALLDSARTAQTATERGQALAGADMLLTGAAPFIPIAAPVRWSLVSPRITGFQPNQFAQHHPASLLAPAR